MQDGGETIDVAIVGAGPAGLMAADAAAAAGRRVVVLDAMPSVGRKLLMAGRSGLNITHAEPFETFLSRYGEAAAWMRPFLERFGPADLRAFCEGLGVETFVGSSGRVFPKAMKASPLLRAWLRRLGGMGVEIRTRRRLLDIVVGPDGLLAAQFLNAQGATETVSARAVVLALGGASWPRLGSTGGWKAMPAAKGFRIAEFAPSNCGVEIHWSQTFREKFESQAIKTAAFSFDGRTIRGEAVVTRRGLEGGPVYALSNAIGEALRERGGAMLSIDLKPDLAQDEIARRLTRRRKGDSLSNALRKTLGLSPLAIGLLREATTDFSAPDAIAGAVKALRLPVAAVAGLDRAISTAGGLSREEVDEKLMAARLPGFFFAGEMLDWDAPTGGYLLQACFATGRAAGAAAATHAAVRDAKQP